MINTTEMQVVFVAMPSKGSVSNGQIRPEVLKKLAHLHTKNPNLTFVAPMVQDYQILKYMDVEPVWSNWGNHCKRLLERSDCVIVFLGEGWETPIKEPSELNTSVGVAEELKYATSLGLPITYM